MPNDYFNSTATPAAGAPVASSPIRTLFAAIDDGFDKLPALAGNASKLAKVNAAGTAQQACVGVTENDNGTLTITVTGTNKALRLFAVDETGTVPIIEGLNSTAAGITQFVTYHFGANVLIGNLRADGGVSIVAGGSPRISFTNTGDAVLLGATNSMTAGAFKSLSGTQNIPTNTTTTLFSLPSLTNGTYIVSCGVGAFAPNNYSDVSIVSVDGTATRITTLQSAINLGVSVSGQNVQVIQTSGITQVVYWTATRVS